VRQLEERQGSGRGHKSPSGEAEPGMSKGERQ
jgi:hypothetical protein